MTSYNWPHQVIREPEDLEALGKELTVRHSKVSQQRLQRLDTVYRCANITIRIC